MTIGIAVRVVFAGIYLFVYYLPEALYTAFCDNAFICVMSILFSCSNSFSPCKSIMNERCINAFYIAHNYQLLHGGFVFYISFTGGILIFPMLFCHLLIYNQTTGNNHLFSCRYYHVIICANVLCYVQHTLAARCRLYVDITVWRQYGRWRFAGLPVGCI